MASPSGTPIAGWEGDIAFLKGSAGTINYVIRCNAWTADILGDANDASGFARWKQTNEGQLVVRGSARGYALKEKFPDLPANADAAGEWVMAMTLTATTGYTLAFTAVINRLSYVKDVENNDMILVEFISDGEVTVTGAYTD